MGWVLSRYCSITNALFSRGFNFRCLKIFFWAANGPRLILALMFFFFFFFRCELFPRVDLFIAFQFFTTSISFGALGTRVGKRKVTEAPWGVDLRLPNGCRVIFERGGGRIFERGAKIIR